MGLDFYAGERHETIEHHEKFLFSLIEGQAAEYPQLTRIWYEYYDDPRISTAQAQQLLHEVLSLLEQAGGLSNKPVAHSIMRLALFFNYAIRSGSEITTMSD